MESNLLNSASDFLHHTHFYFNILSLAAKISARWLHCHTHCTCYSIVSCSPLILSGAHFSSLAINQLHDLSLFKKMTKKQPCSEINAFKNSDPGSSHRRKSAACHLVHMVWLYHSPIPVGRRGVNLLVQQISACRHGLRGGEVGSGRHPVIMPHNIPNNSPPPSSFDFHQLITNKSLYKILETSLGE
jgi:hypothetical protein